MKPKRSRLRVALGYAVIAMLVIVLAGFAVSAMTDMPPAEAGRHTGRYAFYGAALAAIVGLIRGDRSRG